MSHLIMNMYIQEEGEPYPSQPCQKRGISYSPPGWIRVYKSHKSKEVKHNTGCNQDTPVQVDKNSSSKRQLDCLFE